MPNEEGVHTRLRGSCHAPAEEALPQAFGKAGRRALPLSLSWSTGTIPGGAVPDAALGIPGPRCLPSL